MSRHARQARKNGRGAARAAPAPHRKGMRLDVGGLYITAGALAALSEVAISPLALVKRHSRGDFGNVTPEDRRRNMRAFWAGGPVHSAYDLTSGATIWVYTEGPKKWRITTVLLSTEFL